MGERDRFLSAGWGHDPDHEEAFSGYDMANALSSALRSIPDQSVYFQMNLFDSHDTPRLHNNKAIFRKKVYIGCIITEFMLPGMPSIYYGDENLLDGEMGSVEAARYPMCWDEDKWDKDVHEVYVRMGKIRAFPFFAYSSFILKAVDNDCYMLARFVRDKAVVAVINRLPRERRVSLDLFALPSEEVSVLYGNGNASIENGYLEVDLPGDESVVLSLSGGMLQRS